MQAKLNYSMDLLPDCTDIAGDIAGNWRGTLAFKTALRWVALL
jgi:hypothetical protein